MMAGSDIGPKQKMGLKIFSESVSPFLGRHSLKIFGLSLQLIRDSVVWPGRCDFATNFLNISFLILRFFKKIMKFRLGSVPIWPLNLHKRHTAVNA